jgi:hypothetical protein
MIKGTLASFLLMVGTATALAQPCTPSATSLCLSAGRFEVTVTWTDFQSHSGDGQAVRLTADTGYFWFFTNTNVELVVKVLDARGVNGHFWVFYGALSNVKYELTVRDSQTGDVQVYDNPSGQFASVGDTLAFPPSATVSRLSTESRAAGRAGRLVGRPVDESGVAPATWNSAAACTPGATALCLSGGRFRVEAAWKDFQGNTGVGQAVGLTGDTGYFWFFSNTNVEAVIKVLDARPINNHFWVFYGALSNVEYTLTVTDTVTGIVHTYRNPSGLFASVGDTLAFGPPTTFQLIDGGVVKGEIDAETALLYKVYATFGDPRLPQAYVGDPPGQQDHGLMMEVADLWPSLSGPTQLLLEPFLTPPTYAGSWYASGSAVKRSSTQSVSSDWTQIPTARAIVWYAAADAGAQTAANNLAAEIENIWTKEKGLMQKEPLSDGNETYNGGGGKLDIYVTPSFFDPNHPGTESTAQGLTVGYGGNRKTRPAYILIRISAASTVPGARDVLAHEFFHALAANYEYRDGLGAYMWMNEATATWMEDYVYPTQINNLEQNNLHNYFSTGYKEPFDQPDDKGYGDYAFFFYLARSSSPDVNHQIWNGVGQNSALQAIQAAVSLADKWPDFALDCWNQPNVDKFKQWDGISAALVPESAEPFLELSSDGDSFDLASRTVPHLAMSYAYIKVEKDTIKRVEVQNQPLAQGSGGTKITAWIKMADGTTHTEDWTGKERVVYCRDKAGQRVNELMILYTNSSADPNGQEAVWGDGKVIYDSIGCGYQGTAHYIKHEPDGSFDETADVTASFVRVDHTGTTAVYSSPQYTVTYKGKQVDSCTTTFGQVTHTFGPGDPFLLASVLTFDTSSSPATYSCQAPFFIQGTETEVCPYGTSQHAAAAPGIWLNVPQNGQFKVNPDGSFSGTYTDGSSTWTWNFKPDESGGP